MVTLLFTDLVASTEMLTRLGDDSAEEVRRTHFALLREAIARTGGEEVKTLGDGLMVVFSSGVDALNCAVAIQEGMEAHNAGELRSTLSVRVGVHAGEPVRDGADYHGEAVVVASRLCGAAGGGQILTSELVTGLVGSRGGFRFRPVGRLRLKGLPEPVSAVSVEWRTPVGRAPPPRRSPSRPEPAPRGPRLIGRQHELTLLETELQRAGLGEFRGVLLEGEAGVGKTRLVGELVARHGTAVTGLSARAYPLGETTAFGVWIEALERYLRSIDPEEVEQVCAGCIDDLAGLLRSVQAVRGSRPGPGAEPPRARVLEALTVVLSNLASDRPVVVALDDVHLADASSLELLHYVAHGCAEARLLVVATARPTELAERREAAEVLARLDQDGLLRRVVVEALGVDALGGLVEEVTGKRASPALIDWVEERSQGNPLYAIGLLRALLEEEADLSSPVLRRLPENLADRVTARFREFDAATQRVVELLAVFGRRVESRSLIGLWDEGPDDLAETLERLVHTRGVVEDERGHELTYEFAHPLVAEAIYQSIGAGRRRRLHREVGRCLLATGRLGEAALHFVRSADRGDDEAVAVLRAAVREAEDAGSYQEALTILGALVELLPVGDPRWAAVVDALSWDADWVVNHRADTHATLGIPALRAMDAALEGLGAEARRAAVKLRLANFLAWGTGELAEAARLCQEAQRLFDEHDDRRGALLARHEQAWIAYLGGDITALEEGAEGVAREAEELGDERVRSRALITILGVSALQCRFDRVDVAAAESMALARAEGDQHRLRQALWYVGFSSVLQGRSADASAALRASDAVSSVMSDSGPGVEFDVVVAWLTGDYRSALGRARRRGLLSNPVSRQRAFAVSAAGLAAVEMGEFDEARRYVGAARAVYGDRHWGTQSGVARCAAAALDWRQGRAPDAADALSGVVDGSLAWAVAVPALVDLAEIRGRLGVADATASERLSVLAERTGLGCHWGLVELAAAWARFGGADLAETAAHARRAVERLSEVSWPIYLARAEALWGLVTDDRDHAVELLRSAAQTMEGCGALVRREEVLEALAGQGRPGQRAADQALGAAALSEREREIAALAATGLTAAEIGERLFIGKRTVEGHLTRVYGKLGVSGRIELARRAAELGLTGGGP